MLHVPDIGHLRVCFIMAPANMIIIPMACLNVAPSSLTSRSVVCYKAPDTSLVVFCL